METIFKMNNPFDFFDKIYCINLPQNKDRWNTVSKEFEKVGIMDKVERIWATPPHEKCTIPKLNKPIGEFGCWLSHGKAIVHAIESNVENILIVEDDTTFTNESSLLLKTALSELPNNWDILFLGGNPVRPIKQISPTLSKIIDTFYCTMAYSLPKKSLLKFYDEYIELLSNNLPISDFGTSTFAVKNNGYAITPCICYQQPGYSDIQQKHHDYTNTINRNWTRNLIK